MNALLILMQAMVPVIIFISMGVAGRRMNWIKPEADETIMKLTVNVFLPALIFRSMMGNPLLKNMDVVGLSAGLGFGMVALAMWLHHLVAKIIKLQVGQGQRSFVLAGGFQNYGYFPVPIVASMFPDGQALGLLFTHNVGVELALWSIGIAILTGNYSSLRVVLTKMPFWTVVVALMILWSGLDGYVPMVALNTLQGLGNCLVPMGLLMVGGALADLWGKEKFSSKIVIGSVVLRNGLMPAVFFGIIGLIPMPVELKQVMIVQAAMPAAVFPVMMAKYYGGQPAVAAQVAIATTIASLVSLPVIILVGLKWFL